MSANDFSPTWYATFLETLPPDMTAAEVAFVLRYLPPSQYPHLLDIACGYGRHAIRLAAQGYTILGIDKNAEAIRHAQQDACAGVTFRVADMRALWELPGMFDGALNLWHSFGYFDDETNRGILRQVRDKLRPGGRFVVDIYNRESIARFPEMRLSERAGHQILTTYTWSGKRVRCQLTYDGIPGDCFEWRLYTPDELMALSADLGFHCLVNCAWFDENIPPSPEHQRMQLVLERVA